MSVKLLLLARLGLKMSEKQPVSKERFLKSFKDHFKNSQGSQAPLYATLHIKKRCTDGQ